MIQFLRPALAMVLASALAFAPFRAVAQASADGSGASAPLAGEKTSATSPANAPQSDEDQEKAFLHSSAVQAVARILHLSVDTTADIMVGINFAIIFLAIVVPLARVMPKIVRKRSVTLSESLKTARDATAEAKTRLSAVEAKLAGLDEEMKKFRAQLEQESLEEERRIRTAISEETSRIVAAAEQDISMAAAQARRGLRNFAAELAIDHAEKQMSLTPEADRALIAEFVSTVSSDGVGGKR
jgi:F-type H+-transporting ATPase subunit b